MNLPRLRSAPREIQHCWRVQYTAGSRAAHFDPIGEMEPLAHTNSSDVLRASTTRCRWTQQKWAPSRKYFRICPRRFRLRKLASRRICPRRVRDVSAFVRDVPSQISDKFARSQARLRNQLPARSFSALKTHPAQYHIVVALRALPSHAPHVLNRLA